MHRALLLLHCRRSVYPPVLAAARSVLVKGPRVDGPSHLSTIDEPFDTPIGALLRENNSFSSCRQHSHVALVGGLTFSAGADLAVSDALSAQAFVNRSAKRDPCVHYFATAIRYREEICQPDRLCSYKRGPILIM